MSVDNPGRKAVVQCTSDLTSLLKHNLSCSGKLLEKGLITEAVHNYVLTAQGVSTLEKAARLVSCLADRVGGSSQLFHELVQALKEIDPFCGDIVDKLTSLHSCFGALRITTEEEKKQVGITIKRLEKQFSGLQRRLSSELNANGEVSPDILLESLTLLPVALRMEYHKLVLENLPTLEKANSIRKIFNLLNPHISFIDYHLVEYLVEEFGSEQLQEDMSAYVKLVQVFYDETTVEQLMDHWPGRRDIPPHFEELKAVIGEDPGTFTLRRLDNLRKEFCSEVRLFETVLILKRFGRRNSFLVCWVVPSVFVPQLKSAIITMGRFFQQESIFSVTVSTHRLYSIAAEYEERLLLLCREESGDVIDFRDILSHPGLDVNIHDKDGVTPLWYLSSDGRTELVQLLLQHGAVVDLPNDDKYGSTALMAACGEGHMMVAAVLIEKGALVNYKNKKGSHPLHSASFNNRFECVELLLNNDAQIDLPKDDDCGSTALIAACQKGNTRVAQLLIERHSTIDYQDKRGVSPLYVASQNGHDEVVQLLLDGGASVDLSDENGTSPLIIASENGHDEVVQLLLDGGASVDLSDEQGVSPLYIACVKGHDEVVQLLLDRGASVDLQTKLGKKPIVCGQSGTVQDQDSSTKKFVHITPLLAACSRGCTHTASLLIEAGADINCKDKDGWTPLIASSGAGRNDTVELLIEKKAELDIQTMEGWTALSLASWRGHTKVVDILVQAGALINIQDKAGLTPLMLATQNGHASVVKTLLVGRANPNITDKTSGWTAIFFAVKKTNLEIVEMLIKGGANLDIKDNNGLTAVEFAKVRHQHGVCDLFEKYRSKEMEQEIMQGDIKRAVDEADRLPCTPPQPPAPPKESTTSLPEELDFVEHPSEDFFCPVTFELLVDPHLTGCCGNHLSPRAATRLKSEGKPCPICKEPDLATMLDKFHRRKVRAVRVRCPHTSSGCEWVGEVGELSQHIQSCLKRHNATMLDKFHRRKVRAVRVRCPHTSSGCEWVGEVGELSQHIQSCLKRHNVMEAPAS